MHTRGMISSVVIVAVVILGLGTYFLFTRLQNRDDSMMHKTSDEMMDHGAEGTAADKEADMKMQQKGDAMGKQGGHMMAGYHGAVLAGLSAPLLDFSKSDYDAALSSGKLIVLYFYATWCPLCKEEFPKAQEVFNGLTTDTVVGFRVNYNDEKTDADEIALARKFGVAYQHTKVFVKGGKQVLKSPESWDQARYLKEINSAL